MIGRRGMVGRPVARVARNTARVAATTAVVVGTAHVMNNAMNKPAEGQQAAPQQYVEGQPQQVQYVEAQPGDVQYVEQQQYTPAPETDLTAQLLQFAQLHDAGVLTDEEYAAAKAKVLKS
jgi:hypothetical protein